MTQLQILQLNTNPWWSKVKTLYYTGRYAQALSVCEEKFPTLIEKPVAAAEKLLSTSRSGKYETLDIISDILCRCNQEKAALQLYHYTTDSGISDKWRKLGEYKSAVDIIQADHKNSERYHGILGRVYMEMRRYDDAETQFVLALKTRYGYLIQPNSNTDYYSRPLKSSTMVAQKDAVNFLAQYPEDRLRLILSVLLMSIVNQETTHKQHAIKKLFNVYMS